MAGLRGTMASQAFPSESFQVHSPPSVFLEEPAHTILVHPDRGTSSGRVGVGIAPGGTQTDIDVVGRARPKINDDRRSEDHLFTNFTFIPRLRCAVARLFLFTRTSNIAVSGFTRNSIL